LEKHRQWEVAKEKADALEAELRAEDDKPGLAKLYALSGGIDKMVQIREVEDDEARLAYLLEYAQDEDALVRHGIAWELRPIAAELDEAQMALSDLAQDADSVVATAAQQALVQAGGPYAVPYLEAAIIGGGRQGDVALQRALEIDDPAVVPVLIKALEVRKKATADVLLPLMQRAGEFGDPSVVPALEGLVGHSDPAVKALAEELKGDLAEAGA
jgi:HEAT repeat protein